MVQRAEEGWKIIPNPEEMINVNDPPEKSYWASELGVTPERLVELISKHGVLEKRVRRAIQAKGSFELKKAKDGEFYFHLKAANGQIILASEMYQDKRSAENGIASVKKNASSDTSFERKDTKSGHYMSLLKLLIIRFLVSAKPTKILRPVMKELLPLNPWHPSHL